MLQFVVDNFNFPRKIVNVKKTFKLLSSEQLSIWRDFHYKIENSNFTFKEIIEKFMKICLHSHWKQPLKESWYFVYIKMHQRCRTTFILTRYFHWKSENIYFQNSKLNFVKWITRRLCIILGHTLFEKSNFCPKIQFWQNPNIFTSFSPKILWQFFDNFSQSKLSKAKNSKKRSIFTSFHPKLFDNFSRGNQSWIFGPKM